MSFNLNDLPSPEGYPLLDCWLCASKKKCTPKMKMKAVFEKKCCGYETEVYVVVTRRKSTLENWSERMPTEKEIKSVSRISREPVDAHQLTGLAATTEISMPGGYPLAICWFCDHYTNETCNSKRKVAATFKKTCEHFGAEEMNRLAEKQELPDED